jgi:hypothetical protein
MIQIIKTHNLLNGLLFSILEFLVISLVVSPFAIYYLTHERFIYSLISLGIFLNCLTVALIGWCQWRGGEQGLGLRQFMDKEELERVRLANPHLLADTLKLAISALVPFLLIALVVYELLNRREHIS